MVQFCVYTISLFEYWYYVRGHASNVKLDFLVQMWNSSCASLFTFEAKSPLFHIPAMPSYRLRKHRLRWRPTIHLPVFP
jgi:hypothetical protein